jgi:ABC-type lipoprotein release transport system permease subunit
MIILYLVIALVSLNIYNRLFSSKTKARNQSSIMFIFGSGGHTTELLLMLE